MRRECKTVINLHKNNHGYKNNKQSLINAIYNIWQHNIMAITTMSFIGYNNFYGQTTRKL